MRTRKLKRGGGKQAKMNVNVDPRKKTLRIKTKHTLPKKALHRMKTAAMKPKQMTKILERVSERPDEDPITQLRAIRRYLTKVINGLDDMDEVDTISMTFTFLSLGLVEAFSSFEAMFERAKRNNIDELANLFRRTGILNTNVPMGNNGSSSLKSKYPLLFDKDLALENPFETIQVFLDFVEVFLPKAKAVRNSNLDLQNDYQAFASRLVIEIQQAIEEHSSEIREATAEVSTDAEDELADLMKSLGI